MSSSLMVYHSSNAFSFDWASQTFVADASSLNNTFYGNIYNDAADVGFGIISEKTGELAVFYLDKLCQNQEGEVLFWSFKPTTETIKKFPQLNRIIAVVYND